MAQSKPFMQIYFLGSNYGPGQRPVCDVSKKRYQATLIGLLSDEVINKDDLMDFSEGIRNQL